MKEKMIRFMQGRYGIDKRSRCEMVAAIVCLLSNVILHIGMLYGAAVLLLIDMYVRMLSKDIEYRYAQNVKFMKYYSKCTGLFSNRKKKTSRNKKDSNYKIYKCPDCKQKVRVPKGKKKIEIKCPKCQKAFVKRS